MSSNVERLMSEAQATAERLAKIAEQAETVQGEVADAEGAFDEMDRTAKNAREALGVLEASVTLAAMTSEKINGKNAEIRALQTKDVLDNDPIISDARRELSIYETRLAMAHQRCVEAEATAKTVYWQLQALQAQAQLQVAMLNLQTASISYPIEMGQPGVMPCKMPSF
jgi:chromosome segregation ATPase